MTLKHPERPSHAAEAGIAAAEVVTAARLFSTGELKFPVRIVFTKTNFTCITELGR
jgi:hypothetical protein